MKTRTRLPAGFTLIEVLIVIAIIGLLVGILVPAVNIALRTVQKRAIAMEVNTISNAVVQYQQKFNDYPPDGSSLTVIQRHLLKIFPQIASSEIALLTTDTFPGTQARLVNNVGNASPIGVMDPAEALVFFLGGYSDDSVYPLSGVGGPIFITDTNGDQKTSATPGSLRGSVQYNLDRNSPFYEFKESSLTLGQSTGLTISTDEGVLLGNASNNDLLPVYRPTGKQAPYVYFDQRTYSVSVPSAGTFFNHYTTPDQGAARPYKSTALRTTVNANNFANADAYYRYMNDDSFQLISAGLDDLYGGIPFTGSSGGPVFYRFPSGESIDFRTFPTAAPILGDFTNYANGTGINTQGDNATNFSDGVLEDALEN